uniref:hypothetical protein n=1 Tax=Bacteroides thetaiotaomicron TaxID=818 RepID=UPI00359CA249
MNYNKYTQYSIICLLFVLLLSGCEVSGEKGPNNEESATRGLCQYWWSADYLDYDDANIRQEFIFSLDGTGSEIITRTKLGQTTTSNEYFFNWYWASDSYRTVCLEYGENDVAFMDQIFIADNVLTCFMTGLELTFYGRDTHN